jgi:circadian clock protein KaiB
MRSFGRNLFMSQDQPADKPDRPDDKLEMFEHLLDDQKDNQYVLRLFVTGLTARSTQAIDNIKDICEEELKGRYKLEVVDLSKEPELAKQEDIIAAPTLIKKLPLPLRRLIGDLSNKERVLIGLDLRPKS